MKSFESIGKTWIVEINYSAGERVKNLTGLDLFDIAVFERIGNAPAMLIDVLYAVCQPQIEKSGLEKSQFVDSLAGDVIEKAADALTEGIIDFFPRSRREILKKMLAAASQMQEKAMLLIDKRLSDPSLLSELEKQLNKPSGDAPAS